MKIMLSFLLLGSPLFAMEPPLKKRKLAELNHAELGSLLRKAVKSGHIESVEKLLAAGAYVNHSSFIGWIPLHDAVIDDNKKLTKILVKAGADVFRRCDSGWTPLICATLVFNNSYQIEGRRDPKLFDFLITKMLTILDYYQKKRIYSFLFCLKKICAILPNGHYSALCQLMKPALQEFIRSENEPKVLQHIRRIPGDENQRYYLDRYFSLKWV